MKRMIMGTLSLTLALPVASLITEVPRQYLD